MTTKRIENVTKDLIRYIDYDDNTYLLRRAHFIRIVARYLNMSSNKRYKTLRSLASDPSLIFDHSQFSGEVIPLNLKLLSSKLSLVAARSLKVEVERFILKGDLKNSYLYLDKVSNGSRFEWSDDGRYPNSSFFECLLNRYVVWRECRDNDDSNDEVMFPLLDIMYYTNEIAPLFHCSGHDHDEDSYVSMSCTQIGETIIRQTFDDYISKYHREDDVTLSMSFGYQVIPKIDDDNFVYDTDKYHRIIDLRIREEMVGYSTELVISRLVDIINVNIIKYLGA